MVSARDVCDLFILLGTTQSVSHGDFKEIRVLATMAFFIEHFSPLSLMFNAVAWVLFLFVLIAYLRLKKQFTAQHIDYKLTLQQLEHEHGLTQQQQQKIQDIALHNDSLQAQVSKLTSRLREADVRL